MWSSPVIPAGSGRFSASRMYAVALGMTRPTLIGAFSSGATRLIEAHTQVSVGP